MFTIKGFKNNYEIEGENIFANDVVFDHESGKMDLFIFGHEFGAIGAVWAAHLQDAMDEAADKGILDCFLAKDADITEENEANGTIERLGNHSTAYKLTDYFWHDRALSNNQQELELIVALAEARGAQADNLKNY